MRSFTRLYTLAAVLPFFLVRADGESGTIIIRNWADHGDRVDFSADGVNGKVQSMRYQLVGDNQFKLIEAQGTKVENAAAGNGKFWAGLGNGRDANVSLRSSAHPTISRADLTLCSVISSESLERIRARR